MRDRIILIAWSAVFAVAGIAADQFAYQSGIKIAEYEKELADFQRSDEIFLSRSNISSQLRNHYTLDAFFEPFPANSRVSMMEETLERMKKETSGLHRLLKVSDELRFFMPQAEKRDYDSRIANYSGWIEDFTENMASQENWRDKYLAFALYFEVHATVALLASDSVENAADQTRYAISRKELERQLLLALAIMSSLFSLAFLILYIKAYLVAMNVGVANSKIVPSGRRNKYHRPGRYQNARKGTLTGIKKRRRQSTQLKA